MFSAEVFTVNKIHFCKDTHSQILGYHIYNATMARYFILFSFYLSIYYISFYFDALSFAESIAATAPFCVSHFLLSPFQRAILRHQQNTWLTYMIIHYIKSVSSQPIYNHFTYKINQLTFILSYNLRDAPKAVKINQQTYLCNE